MCVYGIIALLLKRASSQVCTSRALIVAVSLEYASFSNEVIGFESVSVNIIKITGKVMKPDQVREYIKNQYKDNIKFRKREEFLKNLLNRITIS